MGITTKVLKAGLKASGEAGATWAAGQVSTCLLKLVGFYSSEDKQKDQAKAWMKEVSTELQVLNTKIDEVSDKLDAGIGEIKTETLYQTYQAQFDNTNDNRTKIDDAYDWLLKIMKQDYDNVEQVKDKVEMLKDYVKKVSLLTTAHSVANVWGAGEHRTTRTLLENWADTCILSMDANIDKLSLHYNNLEYNYVYGVNTLLKAYVVLVALSNYESGCNADEPDNKTAEWLEEETQKYFLPIGESFITSTERMILATYRPDLSVKTILFANNSTIKNIGTRSQLNYFQYTDMDLGTVHPGLIIKEYLRPSMPENGSAKINVGIMGSEKEPVEGKAQKMPEKYVNGTLMRHWYKVVDLDNKGRLMSLEDSDIIIMNYRKEHEELVENEHYTFLSNYPERNYRIDGMVEYVFYDRDTLERVDSDKENAIRMAYHVITCHLDTPHYEAMFISSPDKDPQPWELDDHKKSDLKKHAINDTVVVEGPSGNGYPNILKVKCSFAADMFSKNHNFSFYAKYHIRYAKQTMSGGSVSSLSGNKSDLDKLILVHDTTATVNVEDYKSNTTGMRACDVAIYNYAKIGDDETKYFKALYEEGTHLQDKSLNFESSENEYYPEGATNVDNNTFGIPLAADKETVLYWEVKIKLQTLDGGIPNEKNNDIKGQVEFKGARFAWTVPQPTFS